MDKVNANEITMNIKEFRERMAIGWNTWYCESMTCHVLLPYGFAIDLSIRNKKTGNELRSPQVEDGDDIRPDYGDAVRPDVRSWDGSYTCIKLNFEGEFITIESCVRNDELYILATPGRENSELQLIAEACFLWNYDGAIARKNGHIYAECPNGKQISLFVDAEISKDYLPKLHLPTIVVELNTPATISTVCKCKEDIRKMMNEERKKVIDHAEDVYGTHSTAFLGMQSCLAWNTIFDPYKKRICTTVSRNWCNGKGYLLFCWDTFFAAMMFGLENQKLAEMSVYEILDEMTEDGFVPNYAYGTSTSYDRSQPPVGAMAVEILWNKYKNREFLSAVYPQLLCWNEWFYKNRMMPEGYMCWGTKFPESGLGSLPHTDGVEELLGAKLESGLDNSPMYDDAVFDEEKHLCMLADVGLTGLFIKDCRSLIALAEALEMQTDISILKERLNRAENGLQLLWNEETGIYENLDLTNGKHSNRYSPTNFYSLFSKKITDEQKLRLVKEHLLNTEEFWGEYVLPSISRNDPAFLDQHYWRGPIWGPMNAIVYEALKDAGFNNEAKMLAKKSENLFLKDWIEWGHVHENYNSQRGYGHLQEWSSNFYHWGGLLAYIAIDADKNGD